ncbi:MAG: hypothetical protein WB772_01065 [Xanthobacteraceae bacterium]|jgi:hypothetical protein
MRKFEQLHAEDGLDLALEALRVMCEAKCPTLKRLIAKRGCTAAELWREICAERGYDECEPWQGWPEPPKRDFLKNAPGSDRPLCEHWQKLLDRFHEIVPHMIGRQ